jgi:hypothetical protein
MSMNINRSLHAFVGDIQARGRRRSPLLELYTKSIFGEGRKKSAQELLPPAAADRAWGVALMERGSNTEDEKLSTEAGQLHRKMTTPMS